MGMEGLGRGVGAGRGGGGQADWASGCEAGLVARGVVVGLREGLWG